MTWKWLNIYTTRIFTYVLKRVPKLIFSKGINKVWIIIIVMITFYAISMSGRSENFEMTLKITLQRSIKSLFHSWSNIQTQILHLRWHHGFRSVISVLDAFQRELFISQVLIWQSHIMKISRMNCQAKLGSPLCKSILIATDILHKKLVKSWQDAGLDMKATFYFHGRNRLVWSISPLWED